MEKDYYTIKEILLGLREYYINNQIRLELLKDCISYSKLKYKDVYFNVSMEDGIRNIIMCNIESRFKTSNNPRSNKIIIEDEVCSFQSNEKDIRIINNEKLKQLVNSILNDEFVKQAKYATFVEKDTDGNKIYINIIFDINGIFISPHLNPVIKYIPRLDEIATDIQDEKFELSLDTKISKLNLPKHYCTLLESSNVVNKEISVLGQPKIGRLCEYDIEENNEKILLIKRY